MKPFTRIKVIHGHEYLYEITPYYDPETKRTKHHSKYLGKNVKGTPVKVRSKDYLELSVYSYGEFIVPKKIVEDLQIDKILDLILSKKEVNSLLTLVFNRLIHPLAMRQIEHWYEGTILSLDNPKLPLSSQSLSELLNKISTNEVPIRFLNTFLPNYASQSTLVYDITSITSYSELNSLFEWGYERSEKELPQVNLSIIVNKELGIPVTYDVYPGSLNDVSTLENILKKLKDVGVNSYMLILDRGFCSAHNILRIMKEAKTWIMPAKRNLKSYSRIIEETLFTIENPNNSHKIDGKVLYVMPVTIIVGHNQKISAYLYYDRMEAVRESDRLALKLKDLIENINDSTLHDGENPDEVYEELASSYARFFVYKFKDGKFQVNIKRSEVEKSKQNMGKFILMYQGDMSWDQCLFQYKARDIVEKSFATLKGDLDVMPLHVHHEETMRGLLFVCFLALIIRMRMSHIIFECRQKNDKIDIPTIFNELSKLKMIKFLSGDLIMSEMTKKQREIIKLFGCSA